MKIILNILTVMILIPWFPMCMMSPMSLAAHGAYEKENIIIGLILSYPIIIFSIYWFFDANLFSIHAITLLKWSLFIVGLPVILILGNAVSSLAKSKYVDVTLFPAIEIKLTHNGNPAATAKITQSTTVREDAPTEHIYYANDKGEVNLPIVIKTVRVSPMATLNYRQLIHVNYNHEDFFIWLLDTFNVDKKTDMKSLSVTCELTDDLENIDISGASFRTSCKGDGIVVSTPQKLLNE